MKLSISKNANPNYLAKIVRISSFNKHPYADRLKLCIVDGCNIAVSLDTEPGVFIYFPVECQINKEYLSINNLFKDSHLNKNVTKSGFFEEKGRVRCIKLQKIASEGLVMPINSLLALCDIPDKIESFINVEFDSINDHLLVKKYIPQIQKQPGAPGSRKRKEIKYEDKIVENQFRFHMDTLQLKRNLHQLNSNDYIHISEKWHGTSAIFCNLLTKKKLNGIQKRIYKWLNLNTNEYKIFCSSRKVVKDPDLNKNLSQSYYDCDIWNIALEVIRPLLQKGMSIYAEIVGYLPNGKMIQKDYDYGCHFHNPSYYNGMSPTRMMEEGLFKILIYRITYTNVDGKVFEMSSSNLQQYCQIMGLISVKELFYGTLKEFVGLNNSHDDIKDSFVQKLSDLYLEKQCKYCTTNVPTEGVVVRLDKPYFEAYKLKSILFLEFESRNLDKGEIDIESQE